MEIICKVFIAILYQGYNGISDTIIQSRLQRNVNPTGSLGGGPRQDVPKCLNCGLRGHSILKCDKISRFNELNCRDGLNGSEQVFLVRRHSTGRKTSSNPILTSCRADIPSTVNQLKLPKCRSCGLKGHFTSQCQRDSSPAFHHRGKTRCKNSWIFCSFSYIL